MPRVCVEALQVGVTVAADIRNIDGMLLIPKGASLGERQIGILQAWGIGEVDVESCEGAEDPTDPLSRIPSEQLAELSAEIKGRFWEVDDTNPLFAEVFTQLLLRRVKKLAEDSGR